MSYFSHYSVMGKECIDLLQEKKLSFSEDQRLYSDLTFGAGGHTLGLLESDSTLRVLAVDQDPDAIKNAEETLAKCPADFPGRLELLHMNFVDFPNYVYSQERFKEPPFEGFAGILLDVGVSSHQFDEASRGFSFRKEANLDMRMDYSSDTPTAADLLNDCSEEELANIFYEFGEERFSRRIAKKIVEERSERPFEKTSQLESLVYCCYPKNLRRGRIHPATKCFQALRIAVNRELDVLKAVLPDLFKLLAKNGRLLVISFHSLEDRIVKHSFKSIAAEHSESAKILTKRPLIPTNEEIVANSRSRSAKLRVIEKV